MTDKRNKRPLWLYLLPAVMLAALAAGCASMGRPGGGPRDLDPPRYVTSNPLPGQTGFDGRRIRVYFDENVQVKDAMTKIVVSPVQKTPPSVAAIGRYVQVDLRDTLIPDMTYTIDFADAISDLNEGNVLDGFATDFSTGESIDTLRISGMVFQADNLEPAQGMIVGVYSNLSDTALTTLPFERITKTNQLGRFTIRNLRPGTYRIFALNDLNRDYHWDRTEDVAFYDTLITPTASRVAVSDTLADASGADSIVTREVTAFYPNDILLTWFNENYRAQYMVKNERPSRRLINLIFGAESDTLPQMRVVGGGEFDGLPDTDWSVVVSSPTRDTVSYWITDTALANIDSLRVSVRYQRTDSNDLLSWTTDTLRLFLRGNKTRKAELKKLAEEEERRRKALEKGDTLPLPAPPVLGLSLVNSGIVDVFSPLSFRVDQPLTRIDSSAFHLEIKEDTVWYPVAGVNHSISFANPLNRMAFDWAVDWTPGASYRFTVDSAAMTGAFGEVNRPMEGEFSVKRLEDYSTIRFNLSGADSTAVVELLSSDNPVRRVAVDPATMSVVFEHVNPGTYYARLFLDRDGDGRYTGGSISNGLRQPEEVYYYPRKIKLKKNWNFEQSWNIYELPLDRQKPAEILKNKPPKTAAERAAELERGDREDEDDYDDDEDNPFGGDFTNPGGKRGRNDRNNYNRNQNFGR